MRCVISVSDKTGIIELTQFLTKKGYEILSTSGTRKLLEENSIKCISVSDYTGNQEILGGRVKTLNEKIFGGILCDRKKKDHISDIEKNGYDLIDIVICNLYDFKECLRKKSEEDVMIENIDIGGVSLVRAAAKNFRYVCVLTSPGQYQNFMKNFDEYINNVNLRKELAAYAFAMTYKYDMNIFFYLRNYNTAIPELLEFDNYSELSYGENPHQKAFYFNTANDRYRIKKIAGADISYNNLLDFETALSLLENFNEDNFCCIFKHTIPCGAAFGKNCADSYKSALSSDPVSAFGGIVSFNCKIDSDCASEIVKNFTEAVIAPDFSDESIEILKQKPRLRIVKYTFNADGSELELKTGFTGILFQQKDFFSEKEFQKFSVLDEKQRKTAELAYKICRYVKSNAIVIASGNRIIGVGAGQPNRVDSVNIAIKNAEKFGFGFENAVLVSDGFFPFSDSIELIAEKGIKTVVEPGGSKRDDEVIEACRKNFINLILTETRHFRH